MDVDKVVASFKKAAVKAFAEANKLAAGTDDVRNRLRDALDEAVAELQPQQGDAYRDEPSIEE